MIDSCITIVLSDQKHFQFNVVDDNSVVTIINGIKNTDSSGFDNILNKVVKYIKHQLLTLLIHIVNQSLKTEIFTKNLNVGWI